MRAALVLLLCHAVLAAAPDAFSGGAALDRAIDQAVQRDQIPGAVLLVGHNGKILYRKAYGWCALVPKREPMTADTIFDAASLTKVIATTPCLMKLFEEGKLRLDDPVTKYLPTFQGGKSEITIRNLMTHFSGLRPDLDLKPPWSGYNTGIEKALVDPPANAPGARFVYSDINFILLGEIVHRLSGKTLPEYARDMVYTPLGMKDTMFNPPAALRPRIAPTEIVGGKLLRGVVHDETSRDMGGVAGHAGLFTTADDLARFADMMLGMGEYNGARLFSPLTVRKFTTPESPPDQPVLRGLGWDIDSPYSGNRGELFPIGSYGHTGFTGTSIWIDPVTNTYVILLANSVHPHHRTPITSLRGRVATIVAASLGVDLASIQITGYNETLTGAGIHRVVDRNGEVLNGIDVLEEQKFAPLAGKRVGLITNQTGLDRGGKRDVDRMLAAGVTVAALFAPEHGLEGSQDRANLPDSKDAATGIPVWSLYRGGNRPPEAALDGVDVLVFDIQDVGVRFYTYTTTMGYALEAAAGRHLPFYVLDRPNPVTGVHVEGPLLDAGLESFVGYMPMPLRHGMTMGELARMFNGEKRLGADLHVIPMKGWQRGDWFDSTGLAWTNPSPNMRSLNAALLYGGIAMLEYSKGYSVGRGTDAPFEQIGAEWIDGRELAAALNARYIPGVRVYPTRFQPAGGGWMEGVRFTITSRDAFDSERLGLETASALLKLYPGKINLDDDLRLIGNRQTIGALGRGIDPREIQQGEQETLRKFVQLREKYLIYK
jgi:uncharacterized protein YbbC (DUF1343 family)/CubicO group peptidase (beta-lactamase class C family)